MGQQGRFHFALGIAARGDSEREGSEVAEMTGCGICLCTVLPSGEEDELLYSRKVKPGNKIVNWPQAERAARVPTPRSVCLSPSFSTSTAAAGAGAVRADALVRGGSGFPQKSSTKSWGATTSLRLAASSLSFSVPGLKESEVRREASIGGSHWGPWSPSVRRDGWSLRASLPTGLPFLVGGWMDGSWHSRAGLYLLSASPTSIPEFDILRFIFLFKPFILLILLSLLSLFSLRYSPV